MLAYPIELEVDYPERLSRLLNNPFLFWIKWILAIPHLIIVSAFGYLIYAVLIIVMFAILFTGRYPKGLFDIVAAYARWNARAYGYILLFRDEYPPFSGGEEPAYPVRLYIEQPERPSRWLNNPFLLWIKWVLLIPHLIIITVYSFAFLVVLTVASFAILFTGRYPRGMFEFNVGFLRWMMRILGYGLFLVTDRYPPFSNKPAAEIA